MQKSLNYHQHSARRKDGSACWPRQSQHLGDEQELIFNLENWNLSGPAWGPACIASAAPTLCNEEKQKKKPLLFSKLQLGLGNQMNISQNQVTGFWQLACTAVMCYIKTAHYSSLFVGINNSFSLNTAPLGCQRKNIFTHCNY